MRALISVSDKTGVVELGQALHKMGVEILSTGGTAKALTEAGVPVIPVSDVTGFPECLDGRVKTLHPAIHAGLLAMRENAEHMQQLQTLGITPIDLVVINLYPFKATIMKPDVTHEDAIENIDIGGPTMIRAAAKNYQDVAVLVDPADYATVLDELKQGKLSINTRRMLCYKAFAHTAAYDALISQYLQKAEGIDFPETLTLTFDKVQTMRYGENPHQAASFYKEPLPCPGTLTQAKQLHGKELSYNNISDTNGALDLLREFGTQTAVVAVKHANPCGVGVADTVLKAYEKAYEADPVSIFGGIVATNAVVDANTARRMNEIFLEIVIAPGFTEEALAILKKKKNLRLLELSGVAEHPPTGWDYKRVVGGLLVQDFDTVLLPEGEDALKVVTKRKPTEQEMQDLLTAWRIVKHTKSNGIAIAKDGQSLGVGPGQVNRIWATQQAIERSGEKVQGAALASDAFFPFGDCAEAAGLAGITAIIQPGGSLNDQESIDMCNRFGIAMVFTGMRHFKH